MQFLLSFLGGGVLGLAIAWFILSAKTQAWRERAKNDLVADRASMVEQLRGKDERIEALKQDLGDRDHLIETHQNRITQEATARATAEARLREVQQQAHEKLSLVTTAQQQAQQQLADMFKALSSEALQANNQSFFSVGECPVQ